MDTNVRTPQDVFYLPQHLVVPLFQRPYVWNEEEQWMPLWADVARQAELRLTQPHQTARHFLGAVVLQAGNSIVGAVPTWNIIDGQQRITTLQLLIDAVALVLEERGLDAFAQRLADLTHNRGYGSEEPTLKLRHTNRDGEAFAEVMNTDPPVDHETLMHSGALITRAHAFFARRVSDWLDDAGGDPHQPAMALTDVVTQGLQLVVIDLRADENSQEIFETLNARGTPLTAADLVKNFIFQRIEAGGGDVARAYAEAWPFETPFWEEEVSVGRYLTSRGSLFLSQWLQSRVGEEVGPRHTFLRFKHHIEHESVAPMVELLPLIRQQADIYEGWVRGSSDPSRTLSVAERCFYRMQPGGVEVLKPALIWLHDPSLSIPLEVADEVTASLEAWVVRRQILRLASADLGRVVAEVIGAHRSAPPVEIADRVRTQLSRLSAASTYWPGDDEIRAHLAVEQAYRRYPRKRLRMFLEAVEDRLRATHHSAPVARQDNPVEHILPQSWQRHWPVEGLEAEISRSEHVHRLGNLTLLTASLNSSVSNSSWDSKRVAIDRHDVFLLNRPFKAIETWSETQIDERTSHMTTALLETWPVPAGHVGAIADREPAVQAWVEIKHLVVAGLIEPGTTVMARPGTWAETSATITAAGQFKLDDLIFESPSAAGRAVRGGGTNGWTFWRLADGRTLADVRSTFRGEKPSREQTRARFDWSRLHVMLEALPPATWTTYGELADALGTAAQPVGRHITSCSSCSNAWRVLTRDGRISPDFTWSDPNDQRDPARLLREDGVRLVDEQADSAQLIDSDALSRLVEQPGIDPDLPEQQD